MEKLALALWRPADRGSGELLRALVEEWAAQQLAAPELCGPTLHPLDPALESEAPAASGPEASATQSP